jgi:hypothetical protein
MAANKKALITVATHNGGSPYSLRYDLTCHLRVDRAVVGIRSCLGKRIGELFICIYHLGLEHAICADRRMGNVITVYPGDCRSDGYGDHLWLETEVVDFNLLARCGRLIVRCHDR